MYWIQVFSSTELILVYCIWYSRSFRIKRCSLSFKTSFYHPGVVFEWQKSFKWLSTDVIRERSAITQDIFVVNSLPLKNNGNELNAFRRRRYTYASGELAFVTSRDAMLLTLGDAALLTSWNVVLLILGNAAILTLRFKEVNVLTRGFNNSTRNGFMLNKKFIVYFEMRKSIRWNPLSFVFINLSSVTTDYMEVICYENNLEHQERKDYKLEYSLYICRYCFFYSLTCT